MFKASAPGSMMLLGEYAVLHGKHALVCAVNKRMTVTLTPRTDKTIDITSSLGHLKTDIAHLTANPPFQFVLATLQTYQKNLKVGCNIIIESEFSDKVGFGSSAAVTVAMVAALTEWLAIPLSPEKMIRVARSIIQKVQGIGSGADVASCVLGGVVAYKMQPLLAEKLAIQLPITAVYSGYKTTTVDAIAHVKKIFTQYPILCNQLFSAINACVIRGIQAVREKRFAELGDIMNVQQGLMVALGVSLPLLDGLVHELRQQHDIKGAKISGSGLGDCLIGLGSVPSNFMTQFENQGARWIPIEISSTGVICEKI